MDRENENSSKVSGQSENDLFSITGQNDPPAAASPAPAETPPAEKTPEPVKEPEFKINENERPPVRMLNETTRDPAGREPAVKVQKPAVTLRSPGDASLGTLLTEARTSAGLTVRDVAAATRIRTDYIEALEQDKPDALPNLVFLKAYVRALIPLYGLDANSVAMIEDKLKDLTPASEVPKKLLEDIGKEGQINEEEARKIKMFLIYGAVILILLISLTVTSIVSIRVRNARREAQRLRQDDRPFNTEQLENLLPPQLPKPQMLDVPAPADEQKKPR